MKFSVKSAKAFIPFRVWRTCPNCQQQIDIELALRLSSWSKLAPSNCGVRCPTCKMVLAAHQRTGFAAFWVTYTIVFAFVFVGVMTNQLTRISVLPIVAGMGVFALLMNRWKLRSLIELTVPPPGVVLREVHPSARDYAYLEGKNRREQEIRLDTAVTEDTRPEWICSNCEQSNPASFDLCWKCNHRPRSRTK
jgi:hypothetical protein